MPIINENFDDLTEGVTGASIKATLYKWNPSFDQLTIGSYTAHDFDAIEWAGDLYRVTATALEKLTVGVWTAVSGYSPASGQLAGTPPSLVASTDLHVFAATTSGISTRSYNGTTWTSWSTVVTDSTVRFVGATTSTTVHYLVFDDTSNRFNFKVAIYSGSWSITASDIHWGYPINSFAAKRVNGKDILAFSANVPGINSVRTVGTQLVKYVVPAGAVCVITYQYASWSDHITVEKIDKWSASRFRSNVCMSLIGDTLWLTCYSSEESVTGIRVYSSKDGINWSRGELLGLPISLPYGGVLALLDETLYIVTGTLVLTANSTLWFGTAHQDTVLDISLYITDWSISRRDIQEVNITLGYNAILASTFLFTPCTMALKFETGFGEVLQQIGLFEIDMLEVRRDNPVQLIFLSGRDRLSWLSSRSQSEQFKNWEPQVIGVDEFIDTTGTGYGGLTHVAPFKGSYTTDDSKLVLKTNNEEGIAVSTFNYDEWNGQVQTGFALSMVANNEYAGLVFRLQDKDNGFILMYQQDDDKIHFYERSAGVDTELWASSTRSWNADTNFRYLMAIFQYCRVKFYTGDVSGNWTLLHSMLVDGQDETPIIQAGYVGTIGKGFSDEDLWENSAPLFPIPEYPPDYEDYTYIIADFEYEEAP